MADVGPERSIERLHIMVHQRTHLLERVRVAADGALTEHHQGPRQNVCALDGDGDRNAGVGARDGVAGAARDCVSTQNVHRVVAGFPEELGRVVLHHCRHDRRRRALVETAIRVAAGRLHEVGVATNTSKRLLDAFELADGQAKLLTDERVRAGDASHLLRPRRCRGRKRDAATSRQRLHQHPPATARALDAADDCVLELDDHVVALRRAVPEWNAQRIVALAQNDALRCGGDERTRDAKLRALTQQVVRVEHLER